jgi:hypothetical protein
MKHYKYTRRGVLMKKKKLDNVEPTEILPRKRLKECPHDEESQNRLGNELVDWVIHTDTFTLADFPMSRSLGPSRFYKMARYNEYFADCLDFARHMIAARLQKGWQDKTIDKDYAVRWLPVYDEAFRDMVMQKHRITEETRQATHAASTFNITIPPIGVSEENK